MTPKHRPDAVLLRHGRTLAALALLLALWAMVLDAVRVEWTVNPQYTYGWLVPLLAAFLFLLRWRARPARDAVTPSAGFWLLVGGLALVLLPARLIQEANPDWRLNVWLLAFAASGLTLAVVYAAGGRSWLRHFWFPVVFFLVAVPWPTLIEAPVVRWLTQANASAAVEALHLAGVPALQRGNLIEIPPGVVGIEEACSGIRSFQAGVMLALFFGELTRRGWRGRLGLLAAGVALAFAANFARTLVLVAFALREGVDEMRRWHDPAGLAALGVMFFALWGISQWRKPQGSAAPVGPASAPTTPVFMQRSLLCGFVALACWIVAVEVAVEWWYRHHERNLGAPVAWRIEPPRERPAFQELPLDDAARQILRFDDGLNARWREPDGTAWQVIFLRWFPGRVGVQLAKNHTPEICLAAAGRRVIATSPPEFLELAGLRLPFRGYVVADRGTTAHVFYCLWEDQHPGQPFDTAALNFRTRLAAVAAGRRNLGQRSLELVVWGKATEVEARTALERLLRSILVLETPGSPDAPGGIGS